MSAMELLLWARGPGFTIAVFVFLFGVALRLLEMWGLGRRQDFAPPRPAGERHGGWRTVLARSVPRQGMFRMSPVTYVGGYIFHIGLFVAIFLLPAHIELFRNVFGFGWPALPTTLVDIVTVVTVMTLIVMLVHRLMDPPKRFLSTTGDYVSWALTVAPMATGYLAFHHAALPYTTMLAVHILSAELLLMALPFTKLAHTFTLFFARWYNGATYGRRGVAS